jgi:hypothetical protein
MTMFFRKRTYAVASPERSLIQLNAKRACILLSALVVAASSALGATLDDLYETAQPITTSQDAAFLDALRTVVVRVSGQRDAPARLGSALSNPRQYVQRFGVTENKVLQVGFDDVSIDRLLTQAGLPIWGRERPATMVVLNLEEAGGDWVSFEASPADKERVARAAQERGVPLQWGALDSQDRSTLFASQDEASLMPIARRNNANAILIGRGRRDALQWTLASVDGISQSSGSLEQGVHLAADAFAKVFAAAGNSLTHVTVDVAGITNLDAYASTLNYLEGMTLVRNVAVQSVMGDVLRFRLAVRGDATTLERSISLDNRLVPVPGATEDVALGAPERQLSFRYQAGTQP